MENPSDGRGGNCRDRFTSCWGEHGGSIQLSLLLVMGFLSGIIFLLGIVVFGTGVVSNQTFVWILGLWLSIPTGAVLLFLLIRALCKCRRRRYSYAEFQDLMTESASESEESISNEPHNDSLVPLYQQTQ